MSLTHVTRPPMLHWRPPHLRPALERLLVHLRTHALPFLRTVPGRLTRATWALGLLTAVGTARLIGWFAAEPRRVATATAGVAVSVTVGLLAGYGIGRAIALMTTGLLGHLDLGTSGAG